MKNTLIKDTTLSVRCINCLHAADINTTVELKAHIERFGISYFVKFRNFGYKSIDELRKFVEENKLMKNEVSEDDKKLAIEFAEYCGSRYNYESLNQRWDNERIHLSTSQLFDKFIEQRNK